MKIAFLSRFTLVLLLTLALLPGVRAESEQLSCGHGHFLLAAPDTADFRKYAPSREIDLLHLALDVTPDFRNRTVAGQAILRFKPIARPLSELKLDAVDLRVSEITATEKILAWQVTDKKIIITFAQPIPPDTDTKVTIHYSAEPKHGLYFRTRELGFAAGDEHLWTQGEPNEARHWFPSFDAPNEKFTSEITCRVPDGMSVLSNGRLISKEKESGTGLVAVRWSQEKPHVNYLIALCAGYFKKIEDKYGQIPLAFHVPASQINEAATSFRDTKDMMGFFEREIGVPYPWAKYDQVCVEDFGWGGMENTTLTVLNDRTLFRPETENLRDSQGLVAHELAHQWFGDYVTCKDWSHLWLNEGFATYYEGLYEGHKNGRDAFLYVMYSRAKGITAVPNDTNAIVRRDFNNPEEQFGFHAYPKGSWILHMLRSQVGDELYRRCVKTYLERHALGNVTTDDLNAVFEELSGRSFDQFFDQYVYHAHHPELTIGYSWDERNKVARLSIQQVQKLSEDVLLFNVPLPVRFKTKSGTVDRILDIREKAGEFYVSLPEAPETVRIDPELTLLAKITFVPPSALLDAQLADSGDMLGRLLAVEQMSGRKEALAKLREALNNDPFYGVRLEAAKSLRALQSEEALAALIASTSQSDARVRREVASAIAGFYREASYAEARRVLTEEKNPDIKAVALNALGSYQKPEVRATLLEYLKSDSYRNALADAAIGAVRAQDDVAYLEPLRETLEKREKAFTSTGYARALETLAWLARDEEKKDATREFLVARVNHPRKRVQLAALAGLGTLGDPKAIAVLEKFSSAPKESPERVAADKSIASLRDTKKPGAEVGTLRNEVLTLQRENRELRKEFEEFRKKMELLAPKPAETKTGKAKVKK